MEYYNLGLITGTHGLDGKISIHFDPPLGAYIKKGAFIFIEIRNRSYIPYRITALNKTAEDTAVLSIADFDNIEKAKTISGKKLFLHEEQVHLKDRQQRADYFSGFTIEDKLLGSIGKIDKVIETPQQVLALVPYREDEVMIPLNEDFILRIDDKQKIIFMELPDGLLDI